MKIRVINENDWEKNYDLDKSIIRVGNQISCDIQLKDPGIPPILLQISRTGGQEVKYSMRIFSDNVTFTRGEQSYPGMQMVPYEILDGDKLSFGIYRLIISLGDEKERVRTSTHMEVKMYMSKRDLDIESPINGVLKLKNIGTEKPCQFKLYISGIPEECLQHGPLPFLYPGGVSTVGFMISHLHTKPSPGFHTVSIVIYAPDDYFGEVLEFNQDIYVAPIFKNEIILEDDSNMLGGFNQEALKQNTDNSETHAAESVPFVQETARMIPGQALNDDTLPVTDAAPLVVSSGTQKDPFADEEDEDDNRRSRRKKKEKVVVIRHEDEKSAFDDESEDVPAEDAENPDQSAENSEQPEENSDRSAENPVQPAENSDEAAEDPVQSEENPDRAAEDPVQSVENPDRAAEDPVQSEENPVRAAEDPIQSDENPDRSAENPVQPEERPEPSEETRAPRRKKAERKTKKAAAEAAEVVIEKITDPWGDEESGSDKKSEPEISAEPTEKDTEKKPAKSRSRKTSAVRTAGEEVHETVAAVKETVNAAEDTQEKAPEPPEAAAAPAETPEETPAPAEEHPVEKESGKENISAQNTAETPAAENENTAKVPESVQNAEADGGEADEPVPAGQEEQAEDEPLPEPPVLPDAESSADAPDTDSVNEESEAVPDGSESAEGEPQKAETQTPLIIIESAAETKPPVSEITGLSDAPAEPSESETDELPAESEEESDETEQETDEESLPKHETPLNVPVVHRNTAFDFDDEPDVSEVPEQSKPRVRFVKGGSFDD